MNTNELTIYDTVSSNFSSWEVEKLATGFQFTEGPVWHRDGFLLFSDIPANRIYQLFPGNTATVYLENSGLTGNDTSMLSDMIGSNGLALTKDKKLVICQHGNHALAQFDGNNKIQTLIDKYDHRPFNSPNDLVISKDGTIYFTDPPYGLKEQILHPSRFQVNAGIYRYTKEETQLLSTDLRYPNGICFSPGEEFLYVGSNHPDERVIWKYSLKNGRIDHQSILIEHNADGIKVDDKGRVFLATNEGILIVSAEGKRLALIKLPETPANMAWGNSNYEELYITARSSVYRLMNIQ